MITNDKNQSFGTYCSWMTGKKVFVDGDYAVITFHSDGTIEKGKFLIYFSAVSPGKFIQPGS